MLISKFRFAAFSVFLTAFAIFSFSFPYNFLLGADDKAYIFQNPYVRQVSLENIWDIFSNLHVFFTYIPLTNISYSIDFSIWGLYAPGFHLTQVLLHAANSVLVFVILYRLIAIKNAAFLTAILFAVHPLNIESVVWISERKHLLASFFSLLSFFYYIQFAKNEGSGKKQYFLSFLFFVCGLLSKSIAVVLPAVMVWADFCLFQRCWKLKEKVPFFLLSLAIIFLTLIFEGQKAGALVSYAGGSIWVNFLYTLRVYGDYVLSVFFPITLSPYYHYIYLDLESVKTLVCYIAVPAVIYWFIRFWKEWPFIAFGIGWFVLWLAPVSNFIPLNTFRQDRYLYLPAIAMLAFLASVICSNKFLNERKLFFYTIVFAIGISFSGVTLQYMKVFKNMRPYWLRVAKICPNWAQAQFEAGLEERNVGNIESSIQFYRKAFSKRPTLTKALNNYGATLIDQGKYLKAKSYLERAQELDPSAPDPYYNLAVIESKIGKDEKKIKDLFKRHVAAKEKIKPKDYNLNPYTLTSKNN